MSFRRVSACLSILFFMLFLKLNAQTDIARTQKYVHSPEEDQLLKMIDSVRLEKNLQPLKIDEGLSLAFRKELKVKIEMVPPPGEFTMEGELLALASRFGNRAQTVEGPKDSLFLDKVLRHPRIQAQVLDSTNMFVGLAIQDIEDTSYAFLYFPPYNMSYEPFIPESTIKEKGASYQKVILNIQGKTNAGFLEFMFYQGLELPFDYKGINKEVKEVKTLPDGSFSMTFEISKFGKGNKSIAVFARNKESEPFILVSLLKSGLEF
jgi:hypothetical protein